MEVALSLLAACRAGDEAAVVLLLERGGVDLNETGDRGPPLVEAIAHGRFGVARRLIEAGADVACVDSDGKTALALAAYKGHTETMALLRDRGADINAPTVFSLAVLGRSIAAIRWLIANGLDRNWTNEFGHTALQVAAPGNVPVLSELLDNGFAINGVNLEGETILHTWLRDAPWNPNGVAVVKYLIERNADINARDARGRTPLHVACENPYLATEVLTWILDHGGNMSINVEDQRGWQPLHTLADVVAREGTAHRAGLVTLLLKSGADPNAKTTDEASVARSPLQILLFGSAADRDKTALRVLSRCVRALILYGATWDAGCEQSVVALGALLSGRHLDFVGYVLDDAVVKLSKDLHTRESQDFAIAWRFGIRACVDHWVANRDDVTDVPTEVVQQGAQAVATYLTDYATTRSARIRIRNKLCLVGDSEAGKTTLAVSTTTRLPTLEHARDHTVGIDLFSVQFSVIPEDGQGGTRHHECTLWDFAGHEVYSVAHALFYSPRTIYILLVDMAQYLAKLRQVSQLPPIAEHRAMDRFARQKFFRWVEAIGTRQPDADFVVIGTKRDLVTDVDVVRVWTDLRWRIERWCQAASIPSDNDRARVCEQRSAIARCIRAERIEVSCADALSVARARMEIESVIDGSARGLPMGDNYNEVFRLLSDLRQRPAQTHTNARHRVESLIAPWTDLVNEIQERIPGLSSDEYKSLLRVFHAQGDILWYENAIAGQLCDCVILDPLLVIDLVKEVVTHERPQTQASLHDAVYDEGIMTHDVLHQKPHWACLDDELTQAFKALLHFCDIAYPRHGDVMRWDSDMIVPAYWRVRSAQTHEQERAEQAVFFNPDRCGLCWEIKLSATIAQPVFEMFAVRCHASQLRREIVPNAIKCFDGDEWIARIVIAAEDSWLGTIRVDVAAADQNLAQSRLELFASAMENVLEAHSGLGIARTLIDIDGESQQQTRHCVEALVHELNGGGVVSRGERPPHLDLSWYREKVWRHPGRMEEIRMRAIVRETAHTTAILRTLMACGEQRRMWPALWTATYDQARRIVWLRIHSDLSGRCFHDAFEINIPLGFLAKYGNLIEASVWICTTVVPECITVGVFQTAIDEVAPAVSASVERARVAHNLLEVMNLTTPTSMPASFNSTTDSAMSPAAARSLLRDLLHLKYGPAVEQFDIPGRTGLECVEFNGYYVWAHDDEISRLDGPVTRCEPTYATLVSAVRDHISTSSSTFELEVMVQSIVGVRFWNRHQVSCAWRLVDTSGGVTMPPPASPTPLAEGTTSASDSCSWGDQPLIVTTVGGITSLRDCELQVETRRASRLNSAKIKSLGNGTLALAGEIARAPREREVRMTCMIPLSDNSTVTITLSWRNATFA